MGKQSFVTSEWNKYFKGFSLECRDIYFTEEYARLYETAQDHAECFVYIDGENVFLFPYLKRRVELSDKECFDFETPYGYGGPMANTTDASFISQAAKEFMVCTHSNSIIAGFIRFHPLLNNHELLKEAVQGDYDRKTVTMHLDQDEGDIWGNQIHSKHRNSIRKAEKSGLSYEVDETLEHLDIFKEIYHARMQDLSADNFYYFNDDYFNDLKKLNGQVFLALVRDQEKIIAAALFYKFGIYGHYHLAGSLAESESLGTNNYLIYKTALYLKDQGIKRFHLGGGTDRDPENTLYKFKKRFSPYECSFYLGKAILNQELYQDVCQQWEERFPEKKEKFGKFTLKYRY